jgi:hypothetical protein
MSNGAVTLDHLLTQFSSICGAEHARVCCEMVAVAPANAHEIADVLRYANEQRLTVTLTGGGTKLRWGNPLSTRAQIERNQPRSGADLLFRKLLYSTFPYPSRLRLLALPLLVYQRSGLQALVRGSGVLKLLPRRLQSMEALLPAIPSRDANAVCGWYGRKELRDAA